MVNPAFTTPDALIRNDSPAICRNQPRSRIVSDRASDFRVNYFGESTLPFQVLVTEQHFRFLSIQWYARTDRQVRTPSRWNSANQRSPVPCRQSSLQSLNRHPPFPPLPNPAAPGPSVPAPPSAQEKPRVLSKIHRTLCNERISRRDGTTPGRTLSRSKEQENWLSDASAPN
jgi:hypothetical protein